MEAFIIISRDAQKSSRLINQHVTSGLGAARSTERAVRAVRLGSLMGLAARGEGGGRRGRRGLSSAFRHSGKRTCSKTCLRETGPNWKERDRLLSPKLFGKSCHGSVTDPSEGSPRVSRRGSNTDSQVSLRAMNYYGAVSPATRNRDFVGERGVNLTGRCVSSCLSHCPPFISKWTVIINSDRKKILYKLNLI